jgi:hypothetical protein
MRNLAGDVCGMAGFPSGGNPFGFVSVNMDQNQLVNSDQLKVRNFAHELGHAIGMHHPNGGGGVQYPGTPAIDGESLMNGGSCLYPSSELSPWDRITLNWVYPNKTDLIAKQTNNGNWFVANSNGSSFSSAGQWLSGWAVGTGYNLFSDDVNGDGKADLIAKNKFNGDWFVATSNGSSFSFSPSVWASGFAVQEGYNLLTGDINGDGRADIIAKEKLTGTWFGMTSTGSSFSNSSQILSGWAVGQGYELLNSDANGN